MSECQECGATAPKDVGVCSNCGGVCIRTEPWVPPLRGGASRTPLIASRIPGFEGVRLKVEGAQPSNSFKDRVMEVLVGEAVESGARGAVVASSGNAAVAAASHAARRGLPLLVIVPDTVPEPIIAMTSLRGATLLKAGEGPAAAHELAKSFAKRFGLPNLSSTFSAAGCEWACRSIGHEIAEQLPGIGVRTLAAAVSVGPVLLGAATGLAEAGRGLPRMIAGQAAGCAPIARAYARGDVAVEPWENAVDTRATSIADRLTGYAREGTFFLRRVRETGGRVDAISDEELLEIRGLLARYDGLDVELSSCAALAALRVSGLADNNAVCILTGSGQRETLAPFASFAEARGIEEFCALATGDHEAAKEVETWISTSR